MRVVLLLAVAVVAVIVLPLYGQSPIRASPPDSTLGSGGPSSLETGRILYQQGQYDAALALLQQAVREEGRYAPARYWLGMTWYALGNRGEALKAFRRVVQLDKSWASGHVGLGMIYMDMPNRRLDARRALRNAIKADPDNADIQYYMGMTYMDQERTGHLIGSDRDGRQYFLKTVELNPFHPDAFF
ncbi:MAG: tetratricopeptide repeat protein [Gemmatimonadetes bacterium]|nr:tetratricopeptide repeat protein [Gemmatimonadota bacterium]